MVLFLAKFRINSDERDTIKSKKAGNHHDNKKKRYPTNCCNAPANKPGNIIDNAIKWYTWHNLSCPKRPGYNKKVE